MSDILILLCGLIPLFLGMGFIVRPRQMVKVHARFRKKMVEVEKRLIKSHRALGLFFLLVGLVVIISWLEPIWIYKIVLIVRILSSDIPIQPVETTTVEIPPTIWI